MRQKLAGNPLPMSDRMQYVKTGAVTGKHALERTLNISLKSLTYKPRLSTHLLSVYRYLTAYTFPEKRVKSSGQQYMHLVLTRNKINVNQCSVRSALIFGFWLSEHEWGNTKLSAARVTSVKQQQRGKQGEVIIECLIGWRILYTQLHYICFL